MLMAKHESFLGNIKRLIANLMGVSPDDVEEDATDEVFGDAQPLQGMVALVMARTIQTKAGNDFTQVGYKRSVPIAEMRETMPPEAIERFRREAAMTSRLDHAGICQVYAAGAHDGLPFIAMQYVEGRSLAQLIKEEQPPGNRQGVMEMARIAEEAAEALKLTADHMLEFGLIDEVIKEPVGGAHLEPEKMAKTLKAHISKQLKELMPMDPDERIDLRVNKYRQMGEFDVAKVENA